MRQLPDDIATAAEMRLATLLGSVSDLSQIRLECAAQVDEAHRALREARLLLTETAGQADVEVAVHEEEIERLWDDIDQLQFELETEQLQAEEGEEGEEGDQEEAEEEATFSNVSLLLGDTSRDLDLERGTEQPGTDQPGRAFGSAGAYLSWMFGSDNASKMMAALLEDERDEHRGDEAVKEGPGRVRGSRKAVPFAVVSSGHPAAAEGSHGDTRSDGPSDWPSDWPSDGPSSAPDGVHAELAWIFGGSIAEKMLKVCDADQGEHRDTERTDAERPGRAFGSAGAYLSWMFGSVNASKMMALLEDEGRGHLHDDQHGEGAVKEAPGRVQEGSHAALAWIFGPSKAQKMLALIGENTDQRRERKASGRSKRRREWRRAEHTRWGKRVSHCHNALTVTEQRKALLEQQWRKEREAEEQAVATAVGRLRELVEEEERERDRWEAHTSGELAALAAKVRAAHAGRIELVRRECGGKVQHAQDESRRARGAREVQACHGAQAKDAASDEVATLQILSHALSAEAAVLLQQREENSSGAHVRSVVARFNRVAADGSSGREDARSANGRREVHSTNGRNGEGKSYDADEGLSEGLMALRLRVQQAAEKRRSGAYSPDIASRHLPQPMGLPAPGTFV